MTQNRLRSILVFSALSLVAVGIAAWAYGLGVEDQRYQLADLKEDPLYLRGPGPRIVAGIIVSVLVGALALITRVVVRRTTPSPTRAGGGIRPHWQWLLPLLAAWVGYLAGSTVALAGGGPVLRPGTMRLELGAPLDTAFEVPATCKTAPGKPAVVVAVAGDGGGLPYLRILNEVTGAPVASPTGQVVWITRLQGYAAKDDFVIPGLPDRPPIHQLGAGGTAGSGSSLFVVETPVTFFRAYSTTPTDANVFERSGTALFEATRNHGIMNVDEMIPKDPWPESYVLTLSWTCDLEATKPAPVPDASGGPTILHRTTTPVATAPLSAAAVVPVELRLVTSSESATVEIAGVTIVAVDPPTIEGSATAQYLGGVFRIEQPPEAAAGGRVVGATFRMSIRDVTVGSRIVLTIGHGTTGEVAVTVYNLLGDEPVPVFVHMGSSADQPGWPIELGTEWLVEPVRVESGW